MTLYKDDNTIEEIYSQRFIGGERNAWTVDLGLSKGTYYLMIQAEYHGGFDSHWSDVDYSFTVNATTTSNWEREQNDDFQTANSISINKNYNGSSSWWWTRSLMRDKIHVISTNGGTYLNPTSSSPANVGLIRVQI